VNANASSLGCSVCRHDRDPEIRDLEYGREMARARPFIAGWWHATDTATAAEELAEYVTSALRMAGRHGDAVTAWTQIADRWLAGERAVWRSQWLSLEKLHCELCLPDDDPRVVAVRARQPTAPA
jgi:hypothetical protein